MLAAWWYLLRGKSQKSNVEGTTLFSSCLPYSPRVNSPQTSEIHRISTPKSPTGERVRSVLLRQDGCHGIVEIRPVDVNIPRGHPFWCQVRFIRSGRVAVRQIMADDAYGAVRVLFRRFGGGIDSVSVWLFENEMQAGDPPVLRIDRDGKVWKAKRIAS